jgi:hypothetical protein
VDRGDDAAESGRGDPVPPRDLDVLLGFTSENSSFNEIAKLESALEGEDGGGIATALGMRALGVLSDMRPFDGEDAEDIPSPCWPLGPAFGVVNAEPIVLIGERVDAEENGFRVGLPVPNDFLDIAGIEGSREPNWWAFMPTYFEAIEPGVILVSAGVVLLLGVTMLERG